MSDHLHSKQSGEYEVTGLYGETARGGTRQCCHCQATWVHQPGSGKLRGYCQQCMGFVCGPACAECVPIERRLENSEAGRPENTPAPASVFVPTWRTDQTG